MRPHDLYLGIDVGGTHMRAALVDREGNILERRKALTGSSEGAEAVALRLGRLCRVLVKSAGSIGGRVQAAGLGVAGRIDAVQGRVLFSPNLLPLNGYPLALRLSQALDIPVAMDNDANVFGMGERWKGAGREWLHWVGVTLGTGVGGCLILHGELWSGDNLGFAGEIGHTIIQPDGAPCVCGLRGCLESYASARALVRGAEAAYAQGRLSKGPLLEAVESGALSAEAVHGAAKQGDAVARELFERMGRALGLALANTFAVLGIRHAIIGGGVSAGWDQFMEPLRVSLAEHSSMLDAREAQVQRGFLGDDAALLGAARLAIRLGELRG